MPDVTLTTNAGLPVRGHRKDWIAFGILFASVVLLGQAAFRDLFALYLADSDYSHGFLLVPVALYLLYRRWNRFNPGELPAPLSGFLLTVSGTAMVIFSQCYDAVFRPMTALYLCLAGLGLIVCILGVVMTVWGRANCRMMFFPIAYLAFALPLPQPWMSTLTQSLQRMSAVLAAGALEIAGTPVVREGNVLHLDMGSIGVAAACSGIRSLWCLLAFAVAIVDVKTLRLWKGAVLILAVPFLGMAGNLVRLFVTGLLVAHGRQDLADGRYHEALGLLTVLLPGAAILGLGGLLGRSRTAGADRTGDRTCSETPMIEMSLNGTDAQDQRRGVLPGQASPEGLAHECGSVRGRFAMIATGCVLVLGTCVEGVVRQHYLALYRAMVETDMASLARQKPLSEFPTRIGDFVQVADHELSREETKTLAMSSYIKRTYLKAGVSEVCLSLILWNPRQVDMPRWPVLYPHVADVCYPASGWSRLSKHGTNTREPWLPGTDLRMRVFAKGGLHLLTAYWHSDIHGSRAPRVVSRLKTMFTSWEKPPSTHLRSQFSVKVDVDVRGGDLEQARRTALEFSRLIAPLLPEHGIGEKQADLCEHSK